MAPLNDPAYVESCSCYACSNTRKKLEAEEAPETDMINRPPHYTEHPSGVECIEIVEHMGFCLGNAVKYIWRADLKGVAPGSVRALSDTLEDLKKARWYIDREIERRRGLSESNEPEAGVSGEGDRDVPRCASGQCGCGVPEAEGNLW